MSPWLWDAISHKQRDLSCVQIRRLNRIITDLRVGSPDLNTLIRVISDLARPAYIGCLAGSVEDLLKKYINLFSLLPVISLLIKIHASYLKHKLSIFAPGVP